MHVLSTKYLRLTDLNTVCEGMEQILENTDVTDQMVSVRMVLIQYMLMFFVSINHMIILCMIVMLIFSSITCNADLQQKSTLFIKQKIQFADLLH
jgi:hypothetical protein